MSPVTNELIGRRVKMARTGAELSLKGLGDLVGKSKQNLSNIERGDCTLSYALAVKIAKACNVSADFFAESDDTNTSVN